MEFAEKRKQLVDTGLELLESALVARTWGNISCRVDEKRFLITPSGLDYTKTAEPDIALYDLVNKTWEGPRKPSSEKGIHGAAYALFPEVNFVIHTHQTYATALGLVGWDSMDITEEEIIALGGIARANYGLPGQKSLRENVKKAMQTGAHVIFMVNHGVLVCGTDKIDAMEKAKLLEQICKRNCRGTARPGMVDQNCIDHVKAKLPNMLAISSGELMAQAREGKPIPAQLDDMAQMIGLRIPVVKKDPVAILESLGEQKAVLVPEIGAIVCGKDLDDSQALCLLAHKAAVCARHCEAFGVKVKLPLADVILMKSVYDLKYSKQKG